MPIGYLDVPHGADYLTKKTLVRAMYEALTEAYPFPDDHRIFVREWPLESVSLNGDLGSEEMRPVLVIHVPVNADIDAKRSMLTGLNKAVAEAYGLPEFAIFLHEHTLDTVVINGAILADDAERVREQAEIYDE